MASSQGSFSRCFSPAEWREIFKPLGGWRRSARFRIFRSSADSTIDGNLWPFMAFDNVCTTLDKLVTRTKNVAGDQSTGEVAAEAAARVRGSRPFTASSGAGGMGPSRRRLGELFASRMSAV